MAAIFDEEAQEIWNESKATLRERMTHSQMKGEKEG